MAALESHLKIALESIKCFTDDGNLDIGEINYLMGIAKADGNIDDEEKRVLASVLSKADRNHMDEGTKKRLAEVKAELGI